MKGRRTMKKYLVTAFGEALIDFISTGDGCYRANAGGAPYNLAVCAAKCGVSTAFIGKVGSDSFGDMLRDTAREYGVATEGFVLSDRRPTTHAFVTMGADGENSFVFCRDHGADISITRDELNTDIIKNTTHFHFGGLSLTGEPCKSTLLAALETAVRSGATVSFDPNYRPLLWSSAEDFKAACLSLPVKVDLIKVSENEALMLSGKENIKDAATFLLAYAKAVFVTLGEKGVYAATNTLSVEVEGVKADAVDTTGAGDIFFGTLLSALLLKNGTASVDGIDEATLRIALQKACTVAAKSTEKAGAIPSIPDAEYMKRL